MVHIGNQTACWAATPTEPFDYALASGFDAFEWFPDKKPGAGWDESDLDKDRRRIIRETARARGMRLSVHARWQANPLQPDSYPLFWKDFELAQDLGATLLNIHLCHEAGLAAYVEAILPLVRRSAETGLQLSIENTPHHAPEAFNDLFTRLGGRDEVRTGHVGMCLDLGHANLCAATRNDYLKFLDRLEPQVPIIHLHLHENWGDADTHLPLFTGPAGRDDSGIRGVLERLQQRNFSGSIILEQWPHPPALLNRARDRLLDLIACHAPGLRVPAGLPGPRSAVSAARRHSRKKHSAGLCQDTVQEPLGEDPFLSTLVSADKSCRSWREKLDFVRGLFFKETAPLTTEQLVDIAIYLRFLSTGQVPCAEDGRHFRPAHHARIALQIQERLASLTTPDTAFIIRKIYPWLPSSAQTFQRAEPLTRIRDIAHRNDIPSDLKREIKHSLQNKLHRCAGPEDLVTSSALLERITAPGAGYSPDFVEQFKVFHEELKEFFNARSLDERLNALAPHVGDSDAGLIRQFLGARAGTSLGERLATLGFLTELRQRFFEVVEKTPGLAIHELVLVDIGLEDFAFVLLSEIISAVDAAPSDSWDPLLDALELTLTHLALSRVEPAECHAIGAELRAWRQKWDPADRDQLLRMKATADRSRRLAEDYSDRVMALFPLRVGKLGRALGVAEHAIRVFCDAEIRGHVMFQFSKLVSMLLRRIREKLALPAWDVLVSGQAVGRLMLADSIEALGPDFPEPAVVVLRNAEGDEEIPTGVAGLVLAQEIPHLSHLGVRARQAGVVFVACGEEAAVRPLRALDGQVVALVATAEAVKWAIATGPVPETRKSHPVRIPAVRLTPEQAWVPLDQVTPQNGGGKADGAKRLAELARLPGAGFTTPPGLVVPFGVMEAALHASPDLEAAYRQWLSRINGLVPAEFTGATERLRGLIRQLSVPAGIAAEVAKVFGGEARLIVRSSANCEDLEELAGAGLYESVANTAVSKTATAVRTVWSSLWTRRAALSRKQAGISHEQAHMAVLIQQLLVPDYSFVLHTVNPISHNSQELYTELAVGLGETLASAASRGTPYRLLCDKHSGTVTTLALANFSQALRPAPGGGLTNERVDYSNLELSCDSEARQRLARRLMAVARFVEEAFQRPQDIEGAVVKNEIYLVQARPQQGLPRQEEG